MVINGVDEGSIISNFKPKTQARINIILPAINEKGKQQSAESPGFKSKYVPVDLAEFTKEDFEKGRSLGTEIVPEVLIKIFSLSSIHFLIKSPKQTSLSVPFFIKNDANALIDIALNFCPFSRNDGCKLFKLLVQIKNLIIRYSTK